MLCSIPVSLFMFCVYKSVSFHNKIGLLGGLLGRLVGSIVLQTHTLLGYITGQTHLTTRARPIRDLSEKTGQMSPNKLCWLDQFWHSRPFPTSWVWFKTAPSVRTFGAILKTSIWHLVSPTFGGYLKTSGSEKAFGGHLKTRIS